MGVGEEKAKEAVSSRDNEREVEFNSRLPHPSTTNATGVGCAVFTPSVVATSAPYRSILTEKVFLPVRCP